MRDLRAYTCTFEGCKSGLFEDRDEWFAHELESHRRIWPCLLCSGKSFLSNETFKSHIENTHSHKYPSLIESNIISFSRPTTDFAKTDCPLCDRWSSVVGTKKTPSTKAKASSSRFKRHLANHQEQLALFCQRLDTVERHRRNDENFTLAGFAISQRPLQHHDVTEERFNVPLNRSRDHWGNLQDTVNHEMLDSDETVPQQSPSTVTERLQSPLQTISSNVISSSTSPTLAGLPTVFFELSSMTPNQLFQSRHSASDGTWLPPRPQGSNLALGQSTWYKYEEGITSPLPQEPDRHWRVLYQTYSFYMSASKLFVYPADATKNQVGDGSGNPRVRSLPEDNSSRDNSWRDDSSDDTDVHLDSLTSEDWRELSFQTYLRGNASISHAVFRGPYPRLAVDWLDQGQIRELLPPRYHADGSSKPSQGGGGMTGELAILVALVVYSAPSDAADTALRHCFRRNFMSHQQPIGQGCKCVQQTRCRCALTIKILGVNTRGLRVSIWHEGDRQEGSNPRSTPATPTNSQKLRLFEFGQFPGYGKFVV